MMGENDSILLLGQADHYLQEASSSGNYLITIADDGEAWCSGKPGPRLTEQLDLQMALRSALRMDPDEIFLSSRELPPTDMVSAIILTGHRLVYWWKNGDKDRALLRWHDWKFDAVVEVVDGEFKVLAEQGRSPQSEELSPPPFEPEEEHFTPEEFNTIKESILSQRKPSFRPSAVTEKGDSYLSEQGEVMLQLAKEELPDSGLIFPEGQNYLQLRWSADEAEGTVAFSDCPVPAPPNAVFLGEWTEQASVPHYNDDRVELDEELQDIWPDLEVSALIPWRGEQLGGWPYWTQAPEIVPCPECGCRMVCRFQLSSEAEALIPRLFAAEGTGQILQSPQHPQHITWVWAC